MLAGYYPVSSPVLKVSFLKIALKSIPYLPYITLMKING